MDNYNFYLKQTGEYGDVVEVKYPIVTVVGLPSVKLSEIVVFETGETGQIHDINEDSVRVILFSQNAVKIGTKVTRTDTPLVIPARSDFFGNVISPFGNTIVSRFEDAKVDMYLPVDASPLSIDDRAKITRPLLTGVAIVDIVLPMGKGQRELILGDRKTGKSTFVLSTVKNQIDEGAVAIYAAIGSKKSDIKALEEFMDSDPKIKQNMIVVATSAYDSPGLIFLTPLTAMSLAEYYRDQGRDVLIIMDDLLNHAKFYREYSLIAESFPGRDSYPGNIFYIQAKLLERAGNFKHPEKGEVSITCLPVAETQDADLTGYIISNLMSITDGHLLFDSNVYAKGVRPAINTSLSVTRVGKQTQDNITKDMNRELLSLFSVYEKIENLSHFGSELSESVKSTLMLGEKMQFFFNQADGITIPREVYMILFCMVWLGMVNSETEIEEKRERLINSVKNQSVLQLFRDMLNAKSFNALLGEVGKRKDELLKL